MVRKRMCEATPSPPPPLKTKTAEWGSIRQRSPPLNAKTAKEGTQGNALLLWRQKQLLHSHLIILLGCILWQDISFYKKELVIWVFCSQIAKFVFQSSFTSNSFLIRSCTNLKWFFRIHIWIRILLKVSDRTGSVSSTLGRRMEGCGWRKANDCKKKEWSS